MITQKGNISRFQRSVQGDFLPMKTCFAFLAFGVEIAEVGFAGVDFGLEDRERGVGGVVF